MALFPSDVCHRSVIYQDDYTQVRGSKEDICIALDNVQAHDGK